MKKGTLTRPLVVVDLADVEKSPDKVAAALLSAAENEGFFYLVGHGVPQSAVDAAFALSRQFFHSPEEVKRQTRGETSNAHYVLGYTTEELEEGTMRQGLLCAYDNSRMRDVWPDEADVPEFKQRCLHFMHMLDGVVVKLMRCFALALQLPEDHFTRHMSPADDDNGTALFFNRYPSVEGKTFPPGALRIHEHTDFEVLTLLLHNATGLEICPGKDVASPQSGLSDERWTPVDPLPGAITCNLGDALQYWTDGRIKSTYHRVRVPRPGEDQGDRYSLAYFANAGLHTPLQGPSRVYPPITFVDLLEARKQRVPMDMDPETGVVGPEAMRAYQSYVAGPEVAAVESAPTQRRQLACIDLSNFETRKAEIAAALLAAAENEGFFYLVGHGVPQSAVDAAFALSRSFFAASDEVKNATRGDNSNAHYVLGFSTEELEEGTMRQGMLCAYDNSRMAPLWPSEDQAALPGFKENALRFMHLLDGVVVKVMQCFALALQLPEDHFTRHMSPADDDNGTALFFNRYPSVEGLQLKSGAMRIWPHTDFEVLTLLFQTRPGLEVCPGLRASSAADALDESKWFPVDPVPGAITCNLGDALQYWTDGRIKSTYHRVRVPGPQEFQGDRYSLAYFANCGLHTPLQGPSRVYPPVTFLDILAKRAATVPLVSDPATGKVRVEALVGNAGGPDYASK